VRVSWSISIDAAFELSSYDSIVFVHGWNGGIERTWQSGKVLWPKDFLPKDFTTARVLAFGYQSPSIDKARLGSVNQVADDLLRSLVRKRTGHALSRPIIWVAHSLGGLVVKSVRQRLMVYDFF
jgi:pimeloyl-ACP methyl ester carboxylesterase